MAESTSWTDLLLGLPPQLQGIAVVGAGATIGYLVWTKFLKQLKGEGAEQREFAAVVGNPSTLYDMGPIRELVAQTGLLVQQQVRTNMALEAHADRQGDTATALQTLSGQLGRFIEAYEAQIERAQTNEQLEEARQEGFAQGRASRTRRTARRVPAHKPE